MAQAGRSSPQGLAIPATNTTDSIDAAFLRRFRYVVRLLAEGDMTRRREDD